MQTEPISADRMIEVLTEVVEEEGGHYVYPSDRPHVPHYGHTVCWYVWDGKPDCIAGRALAKLGVSLERLSENEGNSAGEAAPIGFLSEEAEVLLSAAQSISDVYRSWQEALDASLEALRQYREE